MSKITTALVIGGGVAGPVAAMALGKAGIHAAVGHAHPAQGLAVSTVHGDLVV
jgi:heterodisulfide reductase subunit A-like polyferredoxin